MRRDNRTSRDNKNVSRNSVVDEKHLSSKKGSGRKILNRDFQKMSYSRMIFSGLGNLVLLVICFWIHWSLGVLFMIFWLFILPYLDMRRLRRYEAENPTPLPSKDSFDDTDFVDGQGEREEEDRWRSCDDWDAWVKESDAHSSDEAEGKEGKRDSEGKRESVEQIEKGRK